VSSSGANDDLFSFEEEDELEIGYVIIKKISILNLYSFSEAPII
jgi:hypothetical protein